MGKMCSTIFEIILNILVTYVFFQIDFLRPPLLKLQSRRPSQMSAFTQNDILKFGTTLSFYSFCFDKVIMRSGKERCSVC